MTDTPATAEAPLCINGGSIYAHPLFLDQLEDLIREVEIRKTRDPKTWQKKNCTKRLAAIFKLVGEMIPVDPGAPAFRQGDTLGDNRKHWFRAKFLQQYRLFYRFDSTAKVIVLAWVNDEQTLRAYGSRTDAYATFRRLLDTGNPPETFDTLLKDALTSAQRFRNAVVGTP